MNLASMLTAMVAALTAMASGCAEPETVQAAKSGVVSAAKRCERSRRDLDDAIRVLLPRMVDCPPEDGFAAMPCPDVVTNKFAFWASDELFPEYVEDAPDCALSGPGEDHGAICCLTGDVSWARDGTYVGVRAGEDKIFTLLARPDPSVAVGMTIEVCGVVTARHTGGRVPIPTLVGLRTDLRSTKPR